jgi:hypothetical protein
MNYGFHVEAEMEYVEAIHYHLAIDARIADSFISEIEHGISAIRRNPFTWRIVENDVRRYLVHRFPLGPVNTKRWVALPGIWLPGEATKPGSQRMATRRARVAGAWFLRCSLGQVALRLHSLVRALAHAPAPPRASPPF